MRYINTILILLLSFIINVNAQTISGQILDYQTNKPVPFANIYFNNSYNGTTSDIDGNFKLNISQNLGEELVVSYVGYKSQLIKKYESGKFYQIYLMPHIFVLKEIVVIADDTPRKKKIKMFLREFLGQTDNAKKCTIENLSDLHLVYHKSSKNLIAFSSKPLIIHNKALGYRIKYYLDEFEKNNNRINYRGYSIFEEDITISDKEFIKIERRRRKAYFGSIKHFFRVLWNNELKKSKFRVYDDKNTTETTLKSNIQNESDDVKYLIYPNALKIIYNEYKISYLEFEDNDRIFFTKSGYFDPKGHNWQGYMSTQRVGDLLPYEYRPLFVKK